MKSIFIEKEIMPTEEMLEIALGNTYKLWLTLVTHTKKADPDSVNEWNYSSDKYGWSFC